MVQLRASDDVAAQRIWEHFASRLVAIARHSIRPGTRRAYDEEDAVQSMFRSVCSGMAEGRFPDLHDRESLWGLMLVITSQKISNRHRFDQQQKRDIRRTVTDSVFCDSEFRDETLTSREPTAEFAAEFNEICERLFACVADPDLREIAALKLEGYTDSEIAERLSCSRRTVQRRMTMIRRQWQGLELDHG
jgi:RNA polymerase sigma factor (sigma-70 family)